MGGWSLLRHCYWDPVMEFSCFTLITGESPCMMYKFTLMSELMCCEVVEQLKFRGEQVETITLPGGLSFLF